MKKIPNRQALRERFAELDSLADQYVADAAEKAAEAQKLRMLRAWARRQKGCRWADVSEADLKEGQKYIARRVFMSPSYVEMPAAICVWRGFGKGGWHELFGDLYSTTMQAATIQVWI